MIVLSSSDLEEVSGGIPVPVAIVVAAAVRAAAPTVAAFATEAAIAFAGGFGAFVGYQLTQ